MAESGIMKKKLLIMLSALPDTGSRLIGFLTGSRYSHASIALGNEPENFYSFTLKGFRTEHPRGLLKKGYEPFPCDIFTVDVDERTYRKAENMLSSFRDKKDLYHYSVAGLILALIHIPFVISRCFFCSHFVADVLEKSGAMRLEKKSCLYMPKDIVKLKGLSHIFSGTVQEYAGMLA